tara:strand:+ start:35 stop:742 length:708 start_codon:yes stop_codon:yes gene_type:complete
MKTAEVILLVDAVAWPIVILVAMLVLRRPALDLIDRAKSVDVKGVKFELREKLEDARASAEQAAMTVVFSARHAYQQDLRPASNIASARSALVSEDATVFAMSPREAAHGEIVASENPGLFLASMFDDLSKDVRGIAKAIEGQSVSYRRAVDLLIEHDILTSNMARVLQALHDARNIAIHDDQHTITKAEAADWSGIAFGLRQRIDQRARMILDTETVAKLDENTGQSRFPKASS